jgi:hypothetical protein
MPKSTTGVTKKHGDKMEPLIDRTGSTASPGAEEDPAQLQDDDDEDLENDNVEDRRDVGKPNDVNKPN